METTQNYTSYRTAEEYLASERVSEARREYVAGEIVAMAGTSRRHSLIAGNVQASLHRQLAGTPCETHGSDMRVRVEATASYTYPDVTVACGDLRFEDDHVDTLLNPTVIIEILSPSTERRDRGIKWEHYRRIPSLVDYLLISQDVYRIELWTRRSGEFWSTDIIEGLDSTVPLPSINCSLPLHDVYERIPPI